VYERFEPYRPAENTAWSAERVRSLANEIIRLVPMSFGDTRVLMTGTTGTGKSTGRAAAPGARNRGAAAHPRRP
jgi:Tfp pilus assembly pilus retraction ATPase PilT